MSNIGSDVPSYHTESTVLDAVYFAGNPRPTQREAYIARLTTGKTMDERIEGIAGAIYDHQIHTRASIEEVEGRLNRRFDGIENLLRGFITEVREQFSAVNTRLDTMNVRLEAVEGRMEAVEARMEAVEGRMEAVEVRMGAVEVRMGAVDDRLEALETQSDTLTSVLDSHVKEVNRFLRSDKRE